MTQGSLDFNAAASEAGKRDGMARAAANRPHDLEYARMVARQLAKKNGTVHADQVQAVLIAQGIKLKNAAGSLFTGGDFEWTGEFYFSRREKQHRNRLMVWRLKG